MNPVGLQEIDKEHRTAQRPGHGISPDDDLNIRDEPDNKADVGYPYQTPADQHDDHWDYGFSRSPQNAGHTVGERHQEIEEGHDLRPGHAVADRLRASAESSHQHRGEQIDDNAHQFRDGQRTDGSEDRPLLCPVVLACAEILADKGGQRQGEAGYRQKGESLNLGIGTAARHGGGPKGIDICLDEHIRHRDDGILKSRRHAVYHNLLQHKSVRPDILKFQPKDLISSHELPQAEKSAQKLGDDRGQGRGPHIPSESAHKQEIQHHVGHR